jgi:hypothetical protein
VLTDVENNGTERHEGFRQVWASMRVKTVHPRCVGCLVIAWVETPIPLLLYAKEGRVYMKDPVGYYYFQPGLCLYLPYL